jgi:hypothetical protein
MFTDKTQTRRLSPIGLNQVLKPNIGNVEFDPNLTLEAGICKLQFAPGQTRTDRRLAFAPLPERYEIEEGENQTE